MIKNQVVTEKSINILSQSILYKAFVMLEWCIPGRMVTV